MNYGLRKFVQAKIRCLAVYSGDIDPLFREVDPTRQICLAGRTMD
jgi:hypothetical protein